MRFFGTGEGKQGPSAERMAKFVGDNNESPAVEGDFSTAVKTLAEGIVANGGRYDAMDQTRIQELATRSGRTVQEVESEVDQALADLKRED